MEKRTKVISKIKYNGVEFELKHKYEIELDGNNVVCVNTINADEDTLYKLAVKDSAKIISNRCMKNGLTPYNYNGISTDDWEDMLIEAYIAGFRNCENRKIEL